MISTLLGAAYFALAGVIGAAVGWFWRAQFGSQNVEVELGSSVTSFPKKVADAREKSQQASAAAILAELRELTSGVASEVVRHSGSIQAINAELASAKDGDSSAVISAVKKIFQANQQMQEELNKAETRLQEQQRELIKQTEAARTDPLTRIINRRALDEALHQSAVEFENAGKPFSVMMLDVDHFKKFNDTHGHQTGDEVLRFVAQTIKSQLRPNELVARYGGEEFVIMFRGETVAQSLRRAESLRAMIGVQSMLFDGKELRVTTSAGIAEIRPDEGLSGIVKRADDSLYIAKKAGRNNSHWHDGSQILPVQPDPAAVLSTPVAAIQPNKGLEGQSLAAIQPFDLGSIKFSDPSFFAGLVRRVAEWRRGGNFFSILVYKIDAFDSLLGRDDPDLVEHVLKVVANYLRSGMRDMDHMSGFGDCGFSVMLPGAQLFDAAGVADRIRQNVEKHSFAVSEGKVQVTISCGVAEVLEGNDANRVFDRAQRAFEAAQEKANVVFVHDGLNPLPASSLSRHPVFA